MDGITKEFYVKFWDQLQGKLSAVYDHSYLNMQLPGTTTLGLITLLEKKDKDRSDYTGRCTKMDTNVN